MRFFAAVGCVLLLGSSALAQPREVALTPCTQIFGHVPAARLGEEVGGFIPTANFPYRASFSESGRTSVIGLSSPTDTARQLTFFGTNLHSGDLDGDGWTDVVVRRLDQHPVYPVFVDTVIVFWGHAGGVDTTSSLKLTGSNIREAFGSAIAVGDLIGDATPDLVVGAYDFQSSDVPGLPSSAGRIYIYEGGATIGSTSPITITGDSSRYALGVAVAVGDLNGDGRNDLGARGWYSVGFYPERFDYVDVWFGGAPFDTVRDLRFKTSAVTSQGLAIVDANGDAVDDLVWTVYPYDARVEFGGPNFGSGNGVLLLNPGVANGGEVLADLWDINGDGYIDIGFGAPHGGIGTGFVFVYGGGPQIDGRYDAGVGFGGDSKFGTSLASVGDVTGDGLSDFIVGGPNYFYGPDYGFDSGYVAIIKGDSTMTVTGVRDEMARPAVLRLYPAYPNPFNSQTTIRYELRERAEMRIEIFNTVGQRLKVLYEGEEHAGEHSVVFGAGALPSGEYYYRLTTRTQDGRRQTQTGGAVLIR